jgi:hypothetical protein
MSAGGNKDVEVEAIRSNGPGMKSEMVGLTGREGMVGRRELRGICRSFVVSYCFYPYMYVWVRWALSPVCP